MGFPFPRYHACHVVATLLVPTHYGFLHMFVTNVIISLYKVSCVEFSLSNPTHPGRRFQPALPNDGCSTL
eukprot:scaffold458133_cov71-Attheya_sp.AAC.2